MAQNVFGPMSQYVFPLLIDSSLSIWSIRPVPLRNIILNIVAVTTIGIT